MSEPLRAGLGAWHADPQSLAMLVAVGLFYLHGERVRRRRTGHVRGGRRIAFAVGWLVALGSLVSPLASLAHDLLWAHMAQHLLLTLVAAPLLALGLPHVAGRHVLPPRGRVALARLGARVRGTRAARARVPAVVVAAAGHAAVLSAWHVPALHEAALRDPSVHLLQHATFLATAVWLWLGVVDAARGGRRQQAMATLGMAVLIAHGGVLGAWMTFAPGVLYPGYRGVAGSGGLAGLGALDDQQLAGALMWVLPSLLYACVAAAMFVRWLDRVEATAIPRAPGAGSGR